MAERLRKGEQTRAAIVTVALELAAQLGLEGLTIGALAERMAMSKSGVFAHFGSREELQIVVLEQYEKDFAADVLVPALREARGLARLRAIVAKWLERTAREAERGCLYIAGATEYDDRPGAVRDLLVKMVHAWQRELTRATRQAIETGELQTGLDIDELVFQLYGIVLALHHDARLLQSPGSLGRAKRSFERLMASYSPRSAQPAAATHRRASAND